MLDSLPCIAFLTCPIFSVPITEVSIPAGFQPSEIDSRYHMVPLLHRDIGTVSELLIQ